MAGVQAVRVTPERQSDSVWLSLADELHSLQPDAAASSASVADSAAVVVVGAGPSAQALVRLLARQAPALDVLVLNGERFVPYNRAQISSTLADGRPLHRLAAFPAIAGDVLPRVLHGVRVVAIDRDAQTVRLADGRRIHYGKLVLATGARSLRVPPLDIEHPRVRDFRSLDDLQALTALQPRRVVVVGGGLLGIEAARAVQGRCEHVTVLERFPHLLPRQLDQEAAQRVAEQLGEQGIDIRCGRQIAALHAEEESLQLRFDDGSALPADLLISATGVRPETELAASAGLVVDRGILVDAEFRTSDASIHAIGECCEQAGLTVGSLAPCLQHAEQLAAVLTATPLPPPVASHVFQLKISERTIASMGNTRAIDNRVFSFSGAERSYRRLFIEQGQVVGAIVYDRANVDLSPFTAAVAEQRLLSDRELQAFTTTGELSASQLSADAQIICFCANVSRGALLQLQQQGLNRVRIVASTGASQHCGSCASRLETVLGEKTSSFNAWATALGIGMVLLLTLLLSIGWQTPLAESWTAPYRQVDLLWREPLARQFTGFALLAVALVSFAWGYWRRYRRMRQQAQTARLGIHSLTAAAALLLWLLHTGGRTGHGINRWLLLSLLLVAISGALAGAGWLQASQSPWQRRVATGLRVVHWFALLPVPALLFFHIVKTYYY